jgi:hypothetical protein
MLSGPKLLKMLVMPVVVSVILAGCMSDSQEQRDEKMLRSLLNIPSTVKVLYSTTMPNPKGGKKISLGFKFDDAEYWVYTTIMIRVDGRNCLSARRYGNSRTRLPS